MLHIHSKVADMLAGLETSLSDQLDKLFMPVRRWGRELQISAYAGSSNEGVESANNANVPSYNTDTEEGAPDKKVVISLKGITKVFGPKPNAAIELMEKGLTKEQIMEKTGSVVGLKNVNMEIYEGEIFVIIGLSGAGKSTLERCINRLVEPTRGEIVVNDIDIRALEEEGLRNFRRRHIGMVFQNFGLLPHRNVLDNVAFGLEVQGMPRERRYAKARDAIELVGLKGYEMAMPSTLSGGMKQRVGLARALATDPAILLMDEAFSALDPLIRNNMQEELIDIHEQLRKTIVFVTHDLDEALKLGDRIAIMKDGQVVQIGTPEDILSDPANEYVGNFLNGIDRSKVMTCESLMKRPELIIPLRTGPHTALKMMDDADQDIGFVADRDKRFVGLVKAGDLLKAIKGKYPLKAAVKTTVRAVQPDTKAEELIAILVETDYPIPVLNEQDALVGIIHPGSVMNKVRPDNGEIAQGAEA